MRADLIPFYQQYEQLVSHVDTVFNQMKNNYPDCITCHAGCSDCCYALFDLTLIEAMYIHDKFLSLVDENQRKRLVDNAGAVDRKIHFIKRKAFKASQEGRDEKDIMQDIAREKIQCPLLNEKDQCLLYDHRPITCRIYGLPTAIGGASHTCGKTNFQEGQTYPTIKMDQIHDRLYAISSQWVSTLKTKYDKLAEILVPLSMALINDYDDVYLGLKDPDPEKTEKQTKG
ncbi:MAG: YkgJ family cysteine cluster protein [Candidatus Magnetomorum sp.]|nr:YkgJ family cysteine cluster protein [Candidatus Magnetomorum sp.]